MARASRRDRFRGPTAMSFPWLAGLIRMTKTKHPLLFVNLSVSDLPATMEFFSKLGFRYNRRFCDENAACMILNDAAYVMLLRKPFFATFTKRQICDPATHSEAIFARSCASRSEVDDLMGKALEAGATVAKDAVDHGFMYIRGFYDLDGHHWEVLWMDPSAVEA